MLSRVEDACINACTPSQQRWLDGWLVRASPENARRARCIHALAPGLLAFETKLSVCETIYREAALPIHFRITPFSQPEVIDHQLESAGFQPSGETAVMVVQLDPAAGSADDLHNVEAIPPAAFAELVGAWRGSSAHDRRGHADRLLRSPVWCGGFVTRDAAGAPVACAQAVLEGEFIGLYDVHTAEGFRCRGHAGALCRWLLASGAGRGATLGYLQVELENDQARSLYRSLGFVDAYRYHYQARSVTDCASVG